LSDSDGDGGDDSDVAPNESSALALDAGDACGATLSVAAAGAASACMLAADAARASASPADASATGCSSLGTDDDMTSVDGEAVQRVTSEAARGVSATAIVQIGGIDCAGGGGSVVDDDAAVTTTR
jgi:hypothetical protein